MARVGLLVSPLTDEQKSLLATHYGLAHRFAKNHAWKYAPALDRQEVISAAYEGLVYAARKWRPGGAKFSVYAWPWMTERVRSDRDQKAIIPAPRWHRSAMYRARATAGALVAAKAALDRKRWPMEDRPAGQDQPDLRIDVRGAVAGLEPREQTVIREHVILGRSAGEVGRDIGVSRTTVQNIEKSAIAKLRIALDDYRDAG